jgi:hypothetical protein
MTLFPQSCSNSTFPVASLPIPRRNNCNKYLQVRIGLQ